MFGNSDFDGIIMKPMITDDNGISADLLNAFKCGREKVIILKMIFYYNLKLRNAMSVFRSTISITTNNLHLYLSNKTIWYFGPFLIKLVFEQ